MNDYIDTKIMILAESSGKRKLKMNRINYKSEFSKHGFLIVAMRVIVVILIIIGFSMGLLFIIIGVIELVNLSLERTGAFILSTCFGLVFLIIPPLILLTGSHLLVQHQIRIAENKVYISYTPGLLPWKISWFECDLKEYHMFTINKQSIAIINENLEFSEIIIHSKKKRDIEEIEKIGNLLVKLGLKRISIEELLKMRKEKFITK